MRPTQELDPEKRLEYLRKAASYEEGKEKAVRALHETAVRVMSTIFTDLYLPPQMSQQWARRNNRKKKRMPATLARDIATNALGALRARLRDVVSTCLSSHMFLLLTNAHTTTASRHARTPRFATLRYASSSLSGGQATGR